MEHIQKLTELKKKLDELLEQRVAIVNAYDYGSVKINISTPLDPMSSTGSRDTYAEIKLHGFSQLKKDITRTLTNHINNQISEVEAELKKYSILKSDD